MPATVVVRAPRRVVAVRAPLIYLAPVTWTASVVTLPPRQQLVWHDNDTIERDEEWVDCNFGVDARGKALYLGIEGQTRLNFSDITFENGQVRTVDFEEHTHPSGTYRLLDFADGRKVATVRILARVETDKATLTVYMGV